MIDCEQEAKLIGSRLQDYFTPQWHCQYRIDVVNNQYGSEFNFFLDIKRQNHRERSIPLHSLKTTDLTVLERVINGVRQQTELTLNFIDFGHVRWPESQRWIR